MATKRDDLASLLSVVFEIPNNKIKDSENNTLTICGECQYDYDGLPIFDYYTELNNYYIFGVLNTFESFIDKHGWYAEWQDPGTIVLGEA